VRFSVAQKYSCQPREGNGDSNGDSNGDGGDGDGGMSKEEADAKLSAAMDELADDRSEL
jgi:hypothetical protein